MDEITRALVNGEDMEVGANREVLRFAVMKRITCPQTGFVLDVDRAVYYEIKTPETSGSDVVDAEAWDGAYGDAVRNAVESKERLSFGDVLDGRVLFKGQDMPTTTRRAIELGASQGITAQAGVISGG